MNKIHPTAIIYDGAQIGNNVEIGPYCIIGSNVILKDEVILKSHVVVEGYTTIGEKTEIFPFTSIGHRTPDLKYHGEPSKLIIGKNNILREYVNIHPGTEAGGMVTSIGDNCLIMASSHIAHDCILGNNIIFANNVVLGGHVIIEDYVIVGGMSAIHQRVRIGTQSMIGGMSGVEKDVIPFGVVMGERASLTGINLIGMKRRGFNREDIHALRNAYDMMFSEFEQESFAYKLERVEEVYKNNEVVMTVINFIKTEEAARTICQPKY